MTGFADAFTPLTLGPVRLRNRFIRAGANEGMSPAGIPTRAMLEAHRAIARGGVGMSTIAYGAVSAEGLTFPHQFVVNAASAPHLAAIAAAITAEGAVPCLQITHAGAFTQIRPASGRPPMSSSGGFNAAGILSGVLRKRAMDAQDMRNLGQEFLDAARLAAGLGFGAVEIHCGHGYLLNQFTSPLDNRRRDGYGGSAAGRARLPAEIVARVKDGVGHRIAVCAKINTTDGVPGGATAQDAAVLAQALEAAGADLLTLSGGRNIESPWALFSGAMPTDDLMKTAKTTLERVGFWALRRMQPRNITFRELYFLDHAAIVRQSVRMKLALVGGIKSRQAVDAAMAAGFDALALARVLFHDPEFVNKLQRGEIKASGCTSCNRCVARIYAPAGTECVLTGRNELALNQIPAA